MRQFAKSGDPAYSAIRIRRNRRAAREFFALVLVLVNRVEGIEDEDDDEDDLVAAIACRLQVRYGEISMVPGNGTWRSLGPNSTTPAP